MPRSLAVARWIWLIASAVSVAGVAVQVILMPSVLSLIIGVVAALQAALAITAAVLLGRGHNWARWTLTVLAGASVAGLYQCVTHQMWAALAINLVLAGTLGAFQTREAKQFCGRDPDSKQAASTPTVH